MNVIRYLYYKILIMITKIQISRQHAKQHNLKENIKEIKIALGKHDFPISMKSTEFPEG
jgi:hypothetical protein